MKILIVFALAILSGMNIHAQTEDFNQMVARNTSKTVPFIYPQEVANYDYLILDTRTREEFDVSHIPGAMWVGYEEFRLSKSLMASKNQSVIVYCSVGYRSEKIGEQLLSAGFYDVKNLYGGIFHWKNSGYPVIDEKGPTEKVHTYNSDWGKWLTKGVKVNGK